MDVNKLVAAIIAGIPKSLDDNGTRDMLNQAAWPAWATHAVTFADCVTDTEEPVRPGVSTRFFGCESEYYAWMADAYQRTHYVTNVTRVVTSYEWDLGPSLLGTQAIVAQSLR